MKLSKIVEYLNHLDTLSVQQAASATVEEVAKITQIVQSHDIQIVDVATDMRLIQDNLGNLLQQYEQKLTQLRQEIQSLIEQHEPKYFADSTANYQQGIRLDAPDYILKRTPNIDPDSHILLQNRLNTHTNWQFPGMVIRPAHCVGIETLVALDPVYLVDTHSDLFAPVTGLFTCEYQQRLRYYVIEEHTSNNIFWNFPQEQFGFVYAFNYFNFKPWEVIKQYLDEIFVLLRPGGSFLFSFNDCDNWRAVGLTEHHYCCYTPGRLIRKHVLDLGFEITNDHQTHMGTMWMEIRKPGVLDSIRGGQALASIFRKLELDSDPVIEPPTLEPEVVDIPIQRLYNELNLDRLIELANILNVDISTDKTKREFNIKKVRNRISAYLELINYPEATLRQLFKPKEN
jgi:acetolactate synthase small subunit